MYNLGTRDSIPPDLLDLAEAVVPVIQQAYAANAHRHDEFLGDDAVTFGVSVYRNSWFLIEQTVEDLARWDTSRPDSSLVVAGVNHRVHVYRVGNDENVDLDAFRLDEEQTSATKRRIAVTNGQLVWAFDEEPEVDHTPTDLQELVILHAGNPDDGCSGIWVGAPLPTVTVAGSPWAWIEPLWIIERAGEADVTVDDAPSQLRHDQLPEPQIEIELVADEEDGSPTGDA